MAINLEDAKHEVGRGWWPLLEELYRNLPDGVNVVQVKEKFGTLRFYYDGGNDYFDSLVSSAESASMFLCEDCGKVARLMEKNGWYKTLCSDHAKELGYGD